MFLAKSLEALKEQNSLMVEAMKRTERQTHKDRSLLIGVVMVFVVVVVMVVMVEEVVVW